MSEIWKAVPDFENCYQISNEGRIRRKLKNGYALRNPYSDKRGYLHFELYDKPRKTQKVSVHRLVAMVFVENPNNYTEVDHIDRNPSNNKASNLRWVNHTENMRNYANNRMLTINGVTKPMSEWAEESPVGYSTIKQRKQRLGWDDYDSVFKPLRSEIYSKGREGRL